MEKSESIKNLAIALCAFQGAVEKIKKTATNPFFKSKYASLSDILDIIREPLTENGLSFAQFPKGKYGLETMLMHTSGEWLSESYEMEPTKKDPQGAGSVITYQRRYALGAVLGLNIDEDDDGNKASEPVKPAKKETPKEKETLTPAHPKWSEAVKYMQTGGLMSKITEKYILTKETESLLIDLIEIANDNSTINPK
jgi:hypothetical protein